MVNSDETPSVLKIGPKNEKELDRTQKRTLPKIDLWMAQLSVVQ